tara:strand:+ start:1541 stop:1927 length:387 start_codon:yes stop_codon:yes gene_type:complete
MRYLIKARLKEQKKKALLKAIDEQTLGYGSIAYPTFTKCMKSARILDNGEIHWIEVCYCREAFGPGNELIEELPYWEEYFKNIKIKMARDPNKCDGYPVCGDCDCTNKLERKLSYKGKHFLSRLRNTF